MKQHILFELVQLFFLGAGSLGLLILLALGIIKIINEFKKKFNL